MKNIFKYQMLMLVATFSLTFVSCGGDDDDEPDNPNTQTSNVVTGDVSELTLVSLVSDDYNVCFDWYESKLRLTSIAGFDAKMASVGKISKLDDIKIAPTSGWAPQQSWYDKRNSALPLVDNNGYVIMYIYDGKAYYIRLFITLNKSVTGETVGIHYQFQHFIPSNS
ncbi:MAG: hypothetical protein PUC77_02510 [Bacteroidales bacterium]|nr:hypothetical protein [Bacteroidales bacterium]MDD6668064.1 hypothetical protein [Bacteroidales bacterium]